MTKTKFYKINAIAIFSITLLSGLIRFFLFKQYEFQNYSSSEICAWLVLPFFVLVFSLLVSKMILSITTPLEKDIEETQIIPENNFKMNIWKNLFFFTLANALIFLFTPINYFLLKGTEVIIYQKYTNFNGFDYLLISVIAGYIGGFLYTLFSKLRIRYLILVVLLAISGFIMTALVLVNIGASIEDVNTKSDVENDYQNGVDAAMESDGQEISYEQGYESKYQDSIKALKYSFYFEDIDAIKCGSYFADLWDNPLQDKDSTQHVLINFFQDYINLKKYSDVDYFLDQTNDLKLIPQTQKVFDKINQNPVRLKSAFKSYSTIVYYMIPNEIYEESGLQNLTELLLLTHKELYKNKAVLEEIYHIMSLTYEDQSHYGRSDYYLDLKSYISDEVLARLQSSENFYKRDGDSNEINEYTKGEAVWLYTFWSRRYKEQNDQAVFEILNEIQNNYN